MSWSMNANEFETEENTKVEDSRSFDALASFRAMNALQASGMSVHEAYRLVTSADGFRH